MYCILALCYFTLHSMTMYGIVLRHSLMHSTTLFQDSDKVVLYHIPSNSILLCYKHETGHEILQKSEGLI